jgi:hypothetical protein
VVSFEDGAAAITGAFSGYSAFGEAPDEIAVTTGGTDTDVDALVARYTAEGALEWVRTVAGIGGAERGVDAVPLQDGGVISVGLVHRPAVFGAGEPTETIVEIDP